MLPLKDFYRRYIAWINPYWLVTISFFVFITTFGDGNLINRFLNDKKISDLERKIDYYKQEIEKNKAKLKTLEVDKKGVERFAREEYFMKKKNEEVFIIKDK
ncbi:MAG: septum formation initiator family protein [Massilibacteroides sp.]|nr:septum formation initiator family protein [Massilibacteroides sp.]